MVVSLATLSVNAPDAAAFTARWVTQEDVAAALGRRDAAVSLLARALARALLLDLTGRCGWRIALDGRGKPWIEGGPSLSIAHSWGLAAAAVAARGSLGVDVERRRPRNYGALADYAFGPLERSAVETGGALAFYRIWTLREAVAKATGDGLAQVVNRQDLIIGGPATGAWRRGAWRFRHHLLDPAYNLAIAHRA